MHLIPVVAFSLDYPYSYSQKIFKYLSYKRCSINPQLIEKLSHCKINRGRELTDKKPVNISPTKETLLPCEQFIGGLPGCTSMTDEGLTDT
jgi:hypothetical protein